MWWLFVLIGAAEAISSIPLYSTLPTLGNFTTREAANALCADAKPSGWVCDRTLALVSFPGDLARDLGDPTNPLPITGPTSVMLADNWTALWSGSIYNTLAAAGVVTTRYFFTGSTPQGTLSQYACADWTSDAMLIGGTVGASGRTDGRWMNLGRGHCGYARPLVCSCAPPTPGPTAQPTASPTPSVILYSAPASNGNLGSLATTTAMCAAHQPPELSCRETPPFLCYTGQGFASFPSAYGFSPTARVVASDGTPLAASWAGMFSGSHLQNFLLRIPGSTHILGWGGCVANGSPLQNCNNWTSSSADGQAYWKDRTDGFQAGDTTCATTWDVACVCVPGITESPTPS